jgi:hypothetical protein
LSGTKIAQLAVAAVLCVGAGARAQPANDDCANATVIGAIPFTDAVDTTTATLEPGDPPLRRGCDFGNRTAENGVWYRYTAIRAINLELATFGSDYDTLAVAYTGTCGALTEIFCNDDDFNENRVYGEDSRLLVTLAAGEDVHLLVADAEGPGGGALAVEVTESPMFQASLHDSAAHDEDARFPSVTAADSGDFMVVWAGSSPNEVRGRLFDRKGRAKQASFEIAADTFTTRPSVAALGDARFVAVWSNYATIQAQRFEAAGGSVGGAFQVSTSSVYGHPEVDADAAGGFVVTWLSGTHRVVARKFDASGAAQTPELQVGTLAARWPDVSVASDGRFVVSWVDVDGQDGDDYGILGRRYDATGTAQGAPFQVNTYTTGAQGGSGASVAVGASGEFVVVWASDYYQNPDISRTIQGRLFDAAGAPQTGEFQVNSGVLTYGYYGNAYGEDPNYRPDADAAPNGEFVVVWQRMYSGPYGRRLDAAGTPAGPEFQVANFWNPYQYQQPDVAVGPDGSFAVVWQIEIPCCNKKTSLGRAFPVAACPAAPRIGCKRPTTEFKGRLTMKDKSADKGDTIVWKWVKGEATTPGDLGDPLTADEFTFCLYDGGGTLLTEATVDPGGTCGTKPCWKGLGTPPGVKGYRYKNGASNEEGAQKVIAKPGLAGKAKAIFKGRGENLALPAIPVALPLTAQLASTTGACWSAEFRAEGLLKNEPGVFAGKASIPASPSGAFLD